MQILIIVLVGIGFVGAGVLILFFGIRALTVSDVTQRLNEFVTVQTTQISAASTVAVVQRTDIRGSFRARVVEPIIHQVGGLFGRVTPSSSIDRLDRQLTIANNPYGLGAREFFGLRIVFMILGALAAFYIIQQGRDTVNLIAAGLTAYVGFFGPMAWLRRRVRIRQKQFRNGFADALDMLSVTATAGLGFDQSLQRVSEYWHTPVGIEFGRVVAEMEMGVSRRTALRNMADRIGLPELSSFVAVIIQSDQLGMSIADALHAQAQQMRIERRFRAQEAARKVPLKMLFPMMLLIFPAMLAVVCGPSIPILSGFFQVLGGTGFGP